MTQNRSAAKVQSGIAIHRHAQPLLEADTVDEMVRRRDALLARIRSYAPTRPES